MLIIAAGAVLFHWVYYARRRPGVREFLDAIRPFLRMPFDEAFLFAALLADVAFFVGIYLFVTGRR
jgi:hypothetical protein